MMSQPSTASASKRTLYDYVLLWRTRPHSPQTVPLFVQNEDEVAIMKRSGFKDVQMFTDNGVALRIVSATLIVAGIVGLKLAAK